MKKSKGMSRFFFFVLVCCLPAGLLSASGKQAITPTDFFKPSHQFGLRAPAVPLILSDPHFSIWSPFDRLTQANSQHWTGTEHPIIGALRVDGKTYRFMGKDKPALRSVIPAEEGKYWTAAYTFDKPSGDWLNVDFDDSRWRRGEAAFGTSDMPRVKTRWNTKNIWVRRTFTIDDDLSREQLILMYSHDDTFELYLNGERLVQTDYSWNNNVELVLSEAQRKKLKKGKNVIAVHCQNQTGGAYVDFNLYKRMNQKGFDTEAVQKSVEVLPTQSFYTFACGPVELDVVFTAPLLPHDLDLVSTPINYISYRVRSTDKKDHDVQIYVETTPQLAVNDLSQNVFTEIVEKNGRQYLKTGTVDQPYTIRVGDGVRIDWGYAYLTGGNGENTMLNAGDYFGMKNSFIETGKLLSEKPASKFRSDLNKEIPVLAYSQQLGKVGKEGKDGFLMVGYDDVYALEYFYERRMAYWKHDGKVNIYQAFERAAADYRSLMEKCRAFDSNLIEVARETGGVEYAALCALTYRQAVAAHKLVTDKQGNLLFLSKENHSGGFINTVDVTYPSAPLFLYYNPDLLKGMLNGIFHYSESGRWNKPYPAHDLGHYPRANGQNYGEDMPVEEAGNMILLATAISVVEGNATYAQQHWNTLTTWANFLLEKGLDPENQLCTDDFAGHLAHNANLSIKAILAVAGYGKMAEMLGKPEIAVKYTTEAKSMAKAWTTMADDGDHYKLAFDRPGSWSQKYNLVWDKLFDMNIFPAEVAEKEIPYYLKRQAEHKFGLPLDSRKDYTKSDWILWTACLAPDDATFRQLVAPVYRYANETVSRVPISDFHDTNDSKMQNFKARSVVGGYYMKMLFNKLNK